MQALHHAFLADLLAMKCHAHEHRFGLDPRQPEVLLEQNAPQDDNMGICSSIHHAGTAEQGIRHVERRPPCPLWPMNTGAKPTHVSRPRSHILI